MKGKNKLAQIFMTFSICASINIWAQEGVVTTPNLNPIYKPYDANQTLIEANLNILNAYHPCTQGKRLPAVHYKLSPSAQITDMQHTTTLEGDLYEGDHDGFITGMYNSRSAFNDLMTVTRTSDSEGEYSYTVSVSYCEQAPLLVAGREINNLELQGPLIIQDDYTGCQKQGRVISGHINATVPAHQHYPAARVETAFGLAANSGRIEAINCDLVVPLDYNRTFDSRRYIGDAPEKNGVYFYGYSNGFSYGGGLGMQW